MTDEPAIEALRLRQEQLMQIRREQLEYLQQLSVHNRKMLRLTVLLMGIIATGFGYLSRSRNGFNFTRCSLHGPSIPCSSIEVVAGVTVFFFVVSVTSFLLTSNIQEGFEIVEDAESLHGKMQSEREYLNSSTEWLENSIKNIHSIRKSHNTFQESAELSLIMAILFTIVIFYTLITGRSLHIFWLLTWIILGAVYLFVAHYLRDKRKHA